MKRFIDLRGNEIFRNFAWWDTIIDRFLDFGGEWAWSTIAEFRESFKLEDVYFEEDISRYLGLIPSWVPDKESKEESNAEILPSIASSNAVHLLPKKIEGKED